MSDNQSSSEKVKPAEAVLPKPPSQMSEACSRFFSAHKEVVDFIGYISSLAMGMDKVGRILNDSEARPEDDTEIVVEPGGRADDLRKYRQLILQMMLTRGVDNFLSFISELLALVFRTRPETLRTGEHVRVDFVLEHASMEDLIDRLVERRVEQLSFAGMRSLQADLKKTLGFELLQSEEDVERAVRLVESRNLIVHSRGVVNRRYESRVAAEGDSQLGRSLKLWAEQVFMDLGFLAGTVASIDERACSKWKLDRPEVGGSPPRLS